MAKEEDKLAVEDLDFEALDFSMEEEEEEVDPVIDNELDDPEIEEEEEEPTPDPDEKDDASDDDLEEEEEEDKDDPEKPKGEEDDEPRVVDNIMNTLGYELSEEDLEGIDDTEDGLINLTKKIVEKASQEEFDNLVNSTPNVKALYDFERQGGDPQEFMNALYPSTDFNQVEINEDDADTQKEVIRLSLKSKGLSDNRISRNLQAIEDSGNLLEESKDSLQDLRVMQENERERIKEQTVEKQDQAKKQAEEEWDRVNQIVDSNKVKNLPLPEKRKSEFKEFITPDPKTGQSPRDKRAAEMELEDHLAMDLILFYGFDGLNKLIDKKASSQASRSLKDTLKSNKDRGKSNSQDPDLDKSASGNVADLEFRIGE
jgi:hypothetical protein